MSTKSNFWTNEEVTEETLRKREHKKLLEVLCQFIADTKDQKIRMRRLDAALMYMTIDLGSTPRQAVKEAIAQRVDELTR